MKMKSFIVATIVLTLLMCFACKKTADAAGPVLTCDCTPAADLVTGFQLQFGTQAAIDVPALATCGSGSTLVNCATDQKLICYDLGTLPNGPFSVKALAKNSWGSSAYTVPLSGTKSLPTSPSGLKIVAP